MNTTDNKQKVFMYAKTSQTPFIVKLAAFIYVMEFFSKSLHHLFS